MLMGHAAALPKLGSAQNLPLSDPISELDVDENIDDPSRVLYTASFNELASKNVQYDTIIWLSISVLLVLAWGVGIIFLLYLPYRRYVLQKDIASRKLYATTEELVYKVSRPSFVPFLGETKIEKRIPLSLIIGVITEQDENEIIFALTTCESTLFGILGCLQSVYGLRTFKIVSIAQGKAAPIDELQVQGVSDPGFLRKVIVTQASKAIQDAVGSWSNSSQVTESESMSRMESLTLGPAVLRSPTPSKSWKTVLSPHHALQEGKGTIPTDLMLRKLEEVNKSVKKIKFLVERKQAPTGTSKENV